MSLKISGLSKTYPNGVQALKNVSLTIGNNMFGLLGPNGAGKSTLMRTIATLQDPDAGEIWLDDLNVLKQKNAVRQDPRLSPAGVRRLPQNVRRRHAPPPRRHEGHHQRRRAQRNGRRAPQSNQSLGLPQKSAQHLLRRHEAALRHRPGSARQSQTHHRRRAHRRPRPRRAQSLPQSPQLHRPQRHRHSLHPHRRRRPRALPPHGHHQQRPAPARRRARRSSRRTPRQTLDQSRQHRRRTHRHRRQLTSRLHPSRRLACTRSVSTAMPTPATASLRSTPISKTSTSSASRIRPRTNAKTQQRNAQNVLGIFAL